MGKALIGTVGPMDPATVQSSSDEHSANHQNLERGVPLGVTDPPLTSPRIWPLKKELKGEEPEFQELLLGGSSGAHSWRSMVD